MGKMEIAHEEWIQTGQTGTLRRIIPKMKSTEALMASAKNESRSVTDVIRAAVKPWQTAKR